MDWSIHHVNIQAHDVRATAAFWRDMIGIPQGTWTYPPSHQVGKVGHDDDHIAYFGTENRGLHIVKPIPTFTRDNGFLHNPTIGGHVAVTVPDLKAVMRRLDAAGIPYTDAGVYAMKGVHQLYVYDPSMNVVEINQIVA